MVFVCVESVVGPVCLLLVQRRRLYIGRGFRLDEDGAMIILLAILMSAAIAALLIVLVVELIF